MSHRAAVAMAVAVLLFAGGVARSQAGEQFRSVTGLVRLPVIVTARDGTVVRGLTREHFQVFEDGVRQEVQLFAEGEADALPLRLGLLLDTSGSMELDLRDAATAAIRFVEACEQATDVTFVEFDRTVQLGRFAPQSYPMLFGRIRSRKPGDMTALYDAIGVYLQSVAGRRGQHVLILYTDGGDTASSLTFSRVQQMLRSSDVLVYAVGYLQNQSSSARVSQQMQLTQIVRETGGDAYFPWSTDALGEAYDRILEEIDGRYTLGYVPASPPEEGFRRVEVKLADPGGQPDVKIRARPGYFVYPKTQAR